MPSACFVQPPLAYAGLTEEQAKKTIAGDIDVYTSFFRPMKNTISGRQEKTFMKLLVDVKTDEVCKAWVDHEASLCVSWLLAVEHE